MRKGTKIKRAKKYTEPTSVKLDKATMSELKAECVKINIDESTYIRKATVFCLKGHLIKNHS